MQGLYLFRSGLQEWQHLTLQVKETLPMVVDQSLQHSLQQLPLQIEEDEMALCFFQTETTLLTILQQPIGLTCIPQTCLQYFFPFQESQSPHSLGHFSR